MGRLVVRCTVPIISTGPAKTASRSVFSLIHSSMLSKSSGLWEYLVGKYSSRMFYEKYGVVVD